MPRPLQMAPILWGDRHAPPEAIVQQAKALEDAGVADYMTMSDQLVNFIPTQLWTTENTPLAEVLKDPDSLDDPFVMATYAKAHAPSLNIAVATDAVRHGPAQLFRTALTLQNIGQGKTMLKLGAGEVKQLKPFGWKRSHGLKRFEDLLKIFDAMWEADGPIDYEGNHTVMQRASVGQAKPFKPSLWAMGGGPKLLDLATSYCDGITVSAPLTWSPEEAAAEIAKLKEDVERKGRDPDTFGFGMFVTLLLHDDDAVIDAAVDNRIIRWLSACVGRVNPEDWRKVGLEPPVPEGWTYHMKFLPHDTPTEFIDQTLERVPREMAEQSYFCGAPEDAAKQLKGYLDAGIDWVSPVDYLGMVSPVDDAADAFARNIRFCAAMKEMGAK